MVIHASREFIKRFHCRPSLPGQPVKQSLRVGHWSADFFRLGTTPMVLMMNDASFWSIIIPAKGITKLETLLPMFLERVVEVWEAHGAKFDPRNQSLLFLKRSHRPLIGSMNEAIFHIRSAWSEEGSRLDWREMEASLNHMPYGALKDFPDRVMCRLLDEA